MTIVNKTRFSVLTAYAFAASLGLFVTACGGDEDGPKDAGTTQDQHQDGGPDHDHDHDHDGGPDHDHDQDGGPSSTPCDAQHNGNQSCTADNKVQWCHAEGDHGHFHQGDDCAAQGFTCVQISDTKAACVDQKTECPTAGEAKCVENAAYTCVPHDGKNYWAIQNCGTAKECHAHGDHASCEERSDVECSGHGHLHGEHCHCDPGYASPEGKPTECKVSPEAICAAAAGEVEAGHKVTAGTTVAGAEDAHLPIGKVFEVTLPALKESYAHFDADAPGNYTFFFGATAAVSDVLAENGTSIGADHFHVEGAVPACSEALPSHIHAMIDKKGMYILKFVGTFPTATAVKGWAFIK